MHPLKRTTCRWRGPVDDSGNTSPGPVPRRTPHPHTHTHACACTRTHASTPVLSCGPGTKEEHNRCPKLRISDDHMRMQRLKSGSLSLPSVKHRKRLICKTNTHTHAEGTLTVVLPPPGQRNLPPRPDWLTLPSAHLHSRFTSPSAAPVPQDLGPPSPLHSHNHQSYLFC